MAGYSMKFVWHIYVFLYILLFLGFFVWINIMHSNINVISVSALVLPTIVVIALYISQREIKYQAKHVGLVICLSLFVGAFYQLWVHEQQSNFSYSKWSENPKERVWMVDDLLSQYDFIGMDVLTLESILGKATDTSYFEAPRRLVYYLGDERGLISIDSEWLTFDFNEEGFVTTVNIMRD